METGIDAKVKSQIDRRKGQEYEFQMGLRWETIKCVLFDINNSNWLHLNSIILLLLLEIAHYLSSCKDLVSLPPSIHLSLTILGD